MTFSMYIHVLTNVYNLKSLKKQAEQDLAWNFKLYEAASRWNRKPKAENGKCTS